MNCLLYTSNKNNIVSPLPIYNIGDLVCFQNIIVVLSQSVAMLLSSLLKENTVITPFFSQKRGISIGYVYSGFPLLSAVYAVVRRSA